MIRYRLFVLAAAFLLAPSISPAKEVVRIAEKTVWEVPKKKIVSLDEFFATMMKIDPSPSGQKREIRAVVESVETKKGETASIEFKFLDYEYAPVEGDRPGTTFELPMTNMGLPFVKGQVWDLYFDKEGHIARLQTRGAMTQYRKRKDGFVEIRVMTESGIELQAIPNTVMAPEREYENGFYANVDLFREAGMVAGTDNVGGSAITELESISLLPVEVPRVNGVIADDTPWRPIQDGGMAGAIELFQLFAY